jgi:hypothetical protein
MLTGWATDFFYAMLDNSEEDLWNIMDLATLFDATNFLSQITLAGFAMGRAMRMQFIGCEHL